jgi:hypothetical protein
VLQCYLRTATPGEPAAHEVVPTAAGWIDLGRPDARLWVGTGAPAGPAPDGLRIGLEAEPATVGGPDDGGPCVVWQVTAARPAWADD